MINHVEISAFESQSTVAYLMIFSQNIILKEYKDWPQVKIKMVDKL